MAFRPTYIFTYNYVRVVKSGYIDVPANCNAFFVQNESDKQIFVDNRPVKGFPTAQPDLDGSGYGIAGHPGEILQNKQILITFDPTTTVFQVNVTFKTYV